VDNWWFLIVTILNGVADIFEKLDDLFIRKLFLGLVSIPDHFSKVTS